MIGNDWDNELKIIWDSPGFHKFWDIIMHEYATKDIFPAKENIFNALKLTPYSKVKVVIVGQDPYHGVGEANGLWYVYLDPTVGNYSSYNGSNYVWIYANCLANYSSTTECAAKQCP